MKTLTDSRRRPGGVLFAACAALFMVVVDVTVLHVAAPRIADALNPSSAELLWIVDIYPLVIAPLLLIAGVAGDRFGRKAMLMVGLLVFGIASIPAALAATPLILIIARAAMAIGAALIMPSTMSLVRVAYPDRSDRLRAVGIWSAVSASGAAIGPLIGGLLVEYFWWGAVFLINVPLALMVFVAVWKLVPESRSQADLTLDGLSSGLTIVAILSFVFAIKHVAHYGLDLSVAGLLAVAATAAGWFIARQLQRQSRGIEPLLNVRLFRKGSFTIAVLGVLLAMFSIVGLDLLLAQYLQNILGLSPVVAALWLAPMAVATIVGALLAHRFVHRFGSRAAIGCGLGLAGLALIPLLRLGPNPHILTFTLALAAAGLVLDVTMVAANDIIISAVPEDYVGQAAGVEEVAYDLGSGLGIAVLGSILGAAYTARFSPLPGLDGAAYGTARDSIHGAEVIAAQSDPGLAERIYGEAATAFLSGLHLAVSVSVAILLITAVAAFVFIRSEQAPS
jgi:DHA2 family multidrug resistance protein-like MFS transporter